MPVRLDSDLVNLQGDMQAALRESEMKSPGRKEIHMTNKSLRRLRQEVPQLPGYPDPMSAGADKYAGIPVVVDENIPEGTIMVVTKTDNGGTLTGFDVSHEFGKPMPQCPRCHVARRDDEFEEDDYICVVCRYG